MNKASPAKKVAKKSMSKTISKPQNMEPLNLQLANDARQEMNSDPPYEKSDGGLEDGKKKIKPLDLKKLQESVAAKKTVKKEPAKKVSSSVKKDVKKLNETTKTAKTTVSPFTKPTK